MTITGFDHTSGNAAPAGFAGTVALEGVPGGVAFIPASTPLIALNYYDGRFLRADDLNRERRAQRAYVDLSNQAGGAGLVNGFDVSISGGGRLQVSAGLAIDPKGRVLYLPEAVDAKISDLLAAATASGASGASGDSGQPGGGPAPSVAAFAPCEVATTTPTVPVVGGTQLYLIALAHAEGLCGNAEVFGRLCDDACITASDRPYIIDGVVLLLVPLVLHRALIGSSSVTLTDAHLRSSVASAYFADEWDAGASLLSATGLSSNVWCRGAPPLVGDLVPLGVLGSKGGSVGFLDEWIARRERMQSSPHLYWQGRMEMRPWPVFLAQVLQFQCQLAEALTAPAPVDGDDPCVDAHALLGESTKVIEGLVRQLATIGWNPDDTTDLDGRALARGTLAFDAFKKKVDRVMGGHLAGAAASGVLGTSFGASGGFGGAGGPAHVLIDRGIVELPAAGYLPIDLAARRSLRDQVERLLGAGVDLRFCAVRRDQIAHELERAQHMQRISLLRGLDDPNAIERVDILVPDGETRARTTSATGLGFDVDFALGYQEQPEEPERAIALAATGTGAPAAPGATDAAAAAPAGSSEREVDRAEGFEALAPRSRRFVRGVHMDPLRLPLRGAARVDAGPGSGLRVRLAGVGAASDGVRALQQLLLAVTQNRDEWSGAFTKLRKIRFGTAQPVLGDAQALAREVGRRSAAHRLTRTGSRVVSIARKPEQQVVAVAVTAWAASDPFGATKGDSVPLSATLDMYMPTTRSVGLSVRFDGRFEVIEHRSGFRGPEVVVRVIGNVTGQGANLRDAAEGGLNIDSTVVLAQTVENGEHVVAVGPPRGGRWVAISGWGGDPIEGKGSLILAGTDDERRRTLLLADDGTPSYGTRPPYAAGTVLTGQHIVDLVATQDDTIGDAGNRYHDFAVAALGILQGLHPDEPGWSEQAVQDLFPIGSAEVVVDITPTTDWVLFRRRRREDCEDTIAPVPTPSRVVTWFVKAETEDEAQRFSLVLRGGEGEKLPWTRIDTAEYDAGSATLREPGRFRTDYTSAGAGALIRFAGYASNGSGDPVGVARTQGLVGALAPDARLDEDGTVDLVGDPPPDQMVAGTEASVFFVTYDEPTKPTELSCVEVFTADVHTPNGQKLEQAIFAGDAVLTEEIDAKDKALTRLGDVQFDGANADPQDLAAVIDAFRAALEHLENQDDPRAGIGAGWIARDWADAGRAPEAEGQIKAVAEALPVPLETVVESDFSHAGRCPARLYVLLRRPNR